MRFKYKIQLILLSSLAITILFSIPRLPLLRFPQYELPELIARTVYSFLFAVLFFTINLDRRAITLGSFTIDTNRFFTLLLLNGGLFFIVDYLLMRLHLYLFEPALMERLFRFLFNITFVLEFLLIILISYIYRLVFHNQQIKKTNAETRYEVLKNQVNPHFLFNSFNTINSLILRDKEAAVNFVNNMSDVFRYALESRETVTLEEELGMLAAYTAMLNGRHGGKIMMDMDIDNAMLSYKLPPMAMQILVENAVKHNIISARHPLHIRIFTRDNGALVVSNDLHEKKVRERSTGLGLSNLNQRSQYLSNRDIIIQRLDNKFIVTVPLIQ
ncbi:sensor histidine kinase [Chitinophaga niabensis]|uniref:Histidine kinase n=1 Tax=Chitinophaga niabensis TaxID=536979 RepID=A0A1N6G4X0_9BACT|nr:histidine kinase [Chitinophaga niabensis]SIO02501.1 Histidine kinase [Chitinophaga niabensis]